MCVGDSSDLNEVNPLKRIRKGQFGNAFRIAKSKLSGRSDKKLKPVGEITKKIPKFDQRGGGSLLMYIATPGNND